MNNSLEEIREKIALVESIAIAGHTNPDGDAIGACLGLAMSLAAMGKKPMVLLESFSERYSCIPGKEYVIFDRFEGIQPQLFISLDCGDLERLGNAAALFSSVPSINIDHHISNTYFGNMNYVDIEASSTSEIIYRLLCDAMPVNDKIAQSLYAGIIFDTGCFKHSSTTPYTMRIAAEMIGYGIPFTEMQERLFFDRSYSEIRLNGRAMEKAVLACNDRVIYSYITKEEIAELSGSAHELGGIISQLKSLKDCMAAVFLYEKEEGNIKASFRSGEGCNVCRIAEQFGGGGHVRAAGCTLSVSMEEALQMVLQAIDKELAEKQAADQ